jgi:hypothetical protein
MHLVSGETLAKASILGGPWLGFLACVLLGYFYISQKPTEVRRYFFAVLLHAVMLGAFVGGSFIVFRRQLDFVTALTFGCVVMAIYMYYFIACRSIAMRVDQNTMRRATKKKISRRDFIELTFLVSVMITIASVFGFYPNEKLWSW